jgi:AP-2 complex subunit alpha
MDMRGLSVFISEIRKCNTKEEETKKVDKELAKIRGKFKSGGSLRSYDRKKYICKLLYIYMLGYDIDFGHIEAVNLLSSSTYSEKHMGYLACTLLLNENHELVTLITNSIKRDLSTKDVNLQCLALTAIANVGGKEQAESLAQDVQKLLLSGDTKLLVRKKAALTLLRLYRKYPEILPAESWSNRVVSLLGSKDLGVITSVMGLVLGLVQNEPDALVESIQKVVRLLVKLVVNKEFNTNYLYYSIPAPWLQVKLLQLLQYYPPPQDEALLGHIQQVLSRIMATAERSKSVGNKSVSKTNAAHCILFEALNVAIHYDNDKALLINATQLLKRYLQERDTNLRYLALDTLSRMAYSEHQEVIANIRKNQDTILLAMKDPDISIRRRALDLLYSMCNRDNAAEIVGELLNYLPLSDYAIREELVLKIAILAEKFAVDLTWYVDVILNLISQAGDFVSDDIWHRVIQIVTNKGEELQKYTAGTVFTAVSSPAAHEKCVMVAGYILGEFGDMVADQEISSPMSQFQTLHGKFDLVGVATKAMLLSTFMKMYNLYPDNAELRKMIKDVFAKHRSYIDAEIQQRANEYYCLIETGNEDLMLQVLENMPAFPERESSVIKRLLEKQARGKGAKSSGTPQGEEGEEAENGSAENQKESTMFDFGAQQNVQQPPQQSEDDFFSGLAASIGSQPRQPQVNNQPSLDDLFGGMSFAPVPPVQQPIPIQQPMMGGINPLDDMFGPPQPVQPAVQLPVQPTSLASAAASIAQQKRADRELTGATIDEMIKTNSILGSEINHSEEAHAAAKEFFKDLIFANEGVVIEDAHLQVKVKMEFHGSKGRVHVLFGNKTEEPLTQFRAEIGDHPSLQCQVSNVPPLIAKKTQVKQLLDIQCVRPFREPLTLTLFFQHNRQFYRFHVPLPVVLHKFVEPLNIIGADAFFQQWNRIQKGSPNEHQKILQQNVNLYPTIASVKQLLADGMHMSVLENVDPNPNNLVACGTVNWKTGQESVLIRCTILSQQPNNA